MSGGKGQNISGFERKRAKQAKRRRPHADRYRGKPKDDTDMTHRLASLVEHFKNEETRRG